MNQPTLYKLQYTFYNLYKVSKNMYAMPKENKLTDKNKNSINHNFY